MGTFAVINFIKQKFKIILLLFFLIKNNIFIFFFLNENNLDFFFFIIIINYFEILYLIFIYGSSIIKTIVNLSFLLTSK